MILHIPAAVGTFHMGIAGEAFGASVKALKEISRDIVSPESMLMTSADIAAFIGSRRPDGVIFENITFANAAYVSEVLRLTDCPILLWALREPVVPGGRLCLNSLTGSFSASNTVTQVRGKAPFFVLGDPTEENVVRSISDFVAAVQVKKSLCEMKLACIGHTPEGFGFGSADDASMLRTFGVRMIRAEARELMKSALSCTDEAAEPFLERSYDRMAGLDACPAENRAKHAKLYKAYTDFAESNGIGAIASRCWPDYFTDYGAPVCSVLSLLADDGIAVACETDAVGALSVKIGMLLSGSPCFFGDPSAESDGNITFWHCGMAPCSLADPKTGAVTGVHPNRKIGPAGDFACGRIEEGVTVFRIDRRRDGTYAFLISEGTTPDVPKKYIGTSMTVRPDEGSESFIARCISNGLAPHYAVIPGRHADALRTLADMLGCPVIGK